MRIKPELQTEYKEYVAKNSDPYGAGIVRYGEAWAEAMELAEYAGETVQQCAKRTSHEADTEGITGFMYGCAVSALSYFWPKGEELRRWHNLDTQLGVEGEQANESGGVLNPALLNVSVD